MKLLSTILIALLFANVCTATLSATYSPSQYDTDNSTTAFTAPWGFFSTTDLVVTYTDSDEVDTVLTEGSGTDKYSVYAANANYAGGATITTSDTYPSGGRITIERSVPYGQQLSINGDFVPAKPLETQLDKLAAQVQQVLSDFSTTISFPNTDLPTTTYAVTNSATVRAGQAIGFDTSGNITTFNIATEGGAFTAVDTAAGLSASGGTISGKVDDDTLAFSGGNFAIKALGVDTAELAAGAVTLPKLASIATDSVIGRTTAATGVPEVVPIVGATGVGLLIDDDNLADASDLSGATQGSVKAYVDSGGGFSPSSYIGGESVTLPNGLIIKTGTVADALLDMSATVATISFASAFTNGVVSVQLTMTTTETAGLQDNHLAATSVSTNGFAIQSGSTSTGSRTYGAQWMAIGY